MTGDLRLPVTLLSLLAHDAPESDLRAHLAALADSGSADPAELAQLERDTFELHRARAVDRRRAQALSALTETAADLAGRRESDDLLAAICRRARQLLGTDVAYVTLRDEARDDNFVLATDGVVSAEFATMRLPVGVGLGGLVAQTGRPEATADYRDDARLTHSCDIDHRVRAEGLRGIVAVPLMRGREVFGVLLSGSRETRTFDAAEIAHFATLGTHAAIALENARLSEDSRAALDTLGTLHAEAERRAEGVRYASETYDELAASALQGAQIPELLDGLIARLPGEVELRGPDGELVTMRGGSREDRPVGEWIDVSLPAGPEQLGRLRLRVTEPRGWESEILHRVAIVITSVILARRSDSEADDRRLGMLLEELITASEVGPGLQRRAQRAGITADARHVVLVIAPVDPSERWIWLNATRHARRRSALVGTVAGRLVVIEAGADRAAAAESWSRALRTADGTSMTIGASDDAVGIDGLRTAYLDATRAVSLLVALGRTGSWAGATELGIFGRMLGLGGGDDLQGFIARTLGPVIAYDADHATTLLATLSAFLVWEGHLANTSRVLGIHVNTLYQRLLRLTELLGDDWRAPDRRLELHLAIRARALAEEITAERVR